MRIKPIAIFCLLLLVFVLLSCSHKLTVLDASHQPYDARLNHVIDIKEETHTTVEDKKIGSKKIVDFLDSSITYEYQNTIEYVIGDIIVDQYYNSENNAKALFLKDGSLYALIDCNYIRIEIDRNATKEDVYDKIVDTFKNEIDFTAFSYHSCFQSFLEKEDGFGLYGYTWNNKYGDFTEDSSLTIAVNQDGEINSIHMGYKNQRNINYDKFDTDTKSYLPYIEDKLNGIYNTDECKLDNYKIHSSEITLYKKECYVHFAIQVGYLNDNEKRQEICDLLVSMTYKR